MVDNSYPVGAVRLILAVRLLPDTVKFCADDAVPLVALKAVKVPVSVMAGVDGVFTVPLTATFCVVAPVEAMAILPEGVPVAVAARRA